MSTKSLTESVTDEQFESIMKESLADEEEADSLPDVEFVESASSQSEESEHSDDTEEDVSMSDVVSDSEDREPSTSREDEYDSDEPVSDDDEINDGVFSDSDMKSAPPKPSASSTRAPKKAKVDGVAAPPLPPPKQTTCGEQLVLLRTELVELKKDSVRVAGMKEPPDRLALLIRNFMCHAAAKAEDVGATPPADYVSALRDFDEECEQGGDPYELSRDMLKKYIGDRISASLESTTAIIMPLFMSRHEDVSITEDTLGRKMTSALTGETIEGEVYRISGVVPGTAQHRSVFAERKPFSFGSAVTQLLFNVFNSTLNVETFLLQKLESLKDQDLFLPEGDLSMYRYVATDISMARRYREIMWGLWISLELFRVLADKCPLREDK